VTAQDDTAVGPRQEQVGFIGLGRMGVPMARHIADGGFPLTVFDVRVEAANRFCAERPAQCASHLADLSGASVIVTMVPTSKEVEEILLGGPQTKGLADHLRPGTLVIDCSSSDPLVTQRLGRTLAERGIALIDAPVMGGVVFAEDGTLDIFVGGSPADVARARPILTCFGKQILACGALGFGHAMKAINNFVNAQALVTYAEAMTVGAKFGIGLDVMTTALTAATTGRNHPFEKKMVKQVLSGKFATGMALRLIAKDVSLALNVAKKTGAWSPIMNQTSELWSEAANKIGDEVDQTEVVRLWEQRTGIAIGGS
jgi:3-hydroxyisobutyrate dehydrogenase